MSNAIIFGLLGAAFQKLRGKNALTGAAVGGTAGLAYDLYKELKRQREAGELPAQVAQIPDDRLRQLSDDYVNAIAGSESTTPRPAQVIERKPCGHCNGSGKCWLPTKGGSAVSCHQCREAAGMAHLQKAVVGCFACKGTGWV